ncbi:MAG TPA: M48 family metalloprotease [Vicinamibacterales bacterium]|nr:M48 family metalloprotease [Vicinamibacterales bacterium]
MQLARFPLLLAALLALAFTASIARAQTNDQQVPTAPKPSRAGQVQADDVIDRMNGAERAVLERLRTSHPLMEVYIQNVAPDETRGWVPTDDNYFLGQLQFDDGPALRAFGQGQREQRGVILRLISDRPGLGDAFAAMAAPDWRGLERKRYEFTYVRREFLGESRCFVFDVRPLRDGKGFVGRIWIEDRDYNLVRFNGASRGSEETLSGLLKRTLSFHMDGWRVNVAPGVWVPSYIYSEETDLSSASPSRSASNSKRQPRFKSQTRIWGYQARNADRTGSLTTIRIDEPNVADTTESAAQLSPVLSQRRWEQEAEANVLERLEAIGLLAPVGEADKVLETVLNNLIVTNNLSLERPLHARILLTSPLESFTVGHTIVLSRGLIDVLPDEASLATMLAHELSHVALGHLLIDTKFSFADRLMVSDSELLQTLRFPRTPKEEAAADEKVIELLGKSPYHDKLADAGLFLRTLSEQAKQLPRLIQPHIGDYMAANGQMTRLADLMKQAPPLRPDSLDQIAALQLGARLVVDAWSGRVTLDRSPAVPLMSIREKMPFAVTPLMPVIRYAEPPVVRTPVDTVGELRSN